LANQAGLLFDFIRAHHDGRRKPKAWRDLCHREREAVHVIAGDEMFLAHHDGKLGLCGGDLQFGGVVVLVFALEENACAGAEGFLQGFDLMQRGGAMQGLARAGGQLEEKLRASTQHLVGRGQLRQLISCDLLGQVAESPRLLGRCLRLR
jgi:hypothetical protein